MLLFHQEGHLYEDIDENQARHSRIPSEHFAVLLELAWINLVDYQGAQKQRSDREAD